MGRVHKLTGNLATAAFGVYSLSVLTLNTKTNLDTFKYSI
jgi:hypothetical protein